MTNRIQTADEAILELLRDQRHAQARSEGALARIEGKVDAVLERRDQPAAPDVCDERPDWQPPQVPGESDAAYATRVWREWADRSGLSRPGLLEQIEADRERSRAHAEPEPQATSGAGEAFDWQGEQSPEEIRDAHAHSEAQRDGAERMHKHRACPACRVLLDDLSVARRHAATWKALAKRYRERAAWLGEDGQNTLREYARAVAVSDDLAAEIANLKRAPQDVTAAVEAERARVLALARQCPYTDYVDAVYWLERAANAPSTPARPATVGERKLAAGWSRVGLRWTCSFAGALDRVCGRPAAYEHQNDDDGACEAHAEAMGVFAATEPAPAQPATVGEGRRERCGRRNWLGQPCVLDDANHDGPCCAEQDVEGLGSHPDAHGPRAPGSAGGQSAQTPPGQGVNPGDGGERPALIPTPEAASVPDAPAGFRVAGRSGPGVECVGQHVRLTRDWAGVSIPGQPVVSAEEAYVRQWDAGCYDILEPIATPPAEPARCHPECGWHSMASGDCEDPPSVPCLCTPECRAAGRSLRPSREGTGKP